MLAASRWLRLAFQLYILLCVLFLGVDAVQMPQPRSYSTHAYYVLHLPSSASSEDVHAISSHIGTEVVEPVGELPAHYLLRAPRPPDSFRQAKRHESNPYHEESVESQLSEPDPVMERFARDFVPLPSSNGIIKRSSTTLPSSSPVYSLERQVIRKRAKRFIDLSSEEDGDLNADSVYRQKGSISLNPRAPPRPKPSATSRPSAFLSSIARRFAIQDPIFFAQWHLANDDIRDNSLNVTGAWASGITGKGVNVAIVDDGLDMYSQDLIESFHAEGSWDFNDHTPLPQPRLSDDLHGTRCAGEIAAVKNDVCGVGVAYGAGVAGLRILSGPISDADEAAALNYGFDTNHIYSCSWGPPDNGRSLEAPSDLVKKSLINGVQNGRQGKGSVFVFASGNGGGVDDQCNFDGYTNSQYSITIPAIDRKGLHPYYSELCSANMVVSFSSGSADAIHTTDVGERECTIRHGGTSAAAPLAAGIYALVLEARPELSWRDVQHLSVKTALMVNDADPDWQRTGSGYFYNHKYGFGKIDGHRIVEAARTHQLVKPQAWWDSQMQSVGKVLNSQGVSSEITVSKPPLNEANFESLEHVTVTVNIKHQRRGDVEAILESPQGSRSILAKPRRFDDSNAGFQNWTFMSVKHWDENPKGQWKLTVLDRQDNNKTGEFVDWKISLWGGCIDPARAKPYRLPGDEDIALPGKPTEDLDSTPTALHPAHPTDFPNSSKTKSFPKPTEHLPDDHHEAPGESHVPVDDLAPSPDPSSSESSDEKDPSLPYVGGQMPSLGKNQTWVFVAAGVVIVFAGGLIAFLLMRRRQRMKAERNTRRDYFFERVPGADLEEDQHPMTSLGGKSSSGNTLMGRKKSRQARTRDLYDAFGSGSDEDGDEGERSALVPGAELDDEYMDEFLADDGGPSTGVSRATPTNRSTQPQGPPNQSIESEQNEENVLFDADDDNNEDQTLQQHSSSSS